MLRSWSKRSLKLQSFRELDDEERHGLSIDDCEKSVHLLRTDGVIEEGVGALLGSVRHRWFSPLRAWVRFPGIRWVADRVYALVSKWRFRIAGTTCDGGCSISIYR